MRTPVPALSTLLALGLAGGLIPLWTVQANPATTKKSAPLTTRERAEHAVSRLTFGATPGEVDQVEAMGVKKWIDLQLHPERIDDGALEKRLTDFPALDMPLSERIAAYPPAAVIRAADRGKVLLPENRVERAIYQDQIADYKIRIQAQQEKSQASSSNPLQPPSSNTAGGGDLQADERQLYADLDSTSVLNLPPEQRFAKLVGMDPRDFRGFIHGLKGPERNGLTGGMTPQEKEAVLAMISPTALVSGELLESRLLTDVYSQRQLQAVMTDFWLNHFNVYIRKGAFAPWYLVDFERNAIAPHAMGRFEDLLVATAQSPAMLFYLDNIESVGPHSFAAERADRNPKKPNGRKTGLNENYGRELMELHTLGADSGYTQQDVIAAAKVLTGWTIVPPQRGSGFMFDERRHEPGTKLLLGRKIHEGGEREGLEFLHMLAASPATAHHLSEQLALRFVSDNPPASLVNRMTRSYLKTDGDIRSVLETMFDSPEFWSRTAYRAKVKTPEEFVISALRATGADVVRPMPAVAAIGRLGMPFYGCQPPNGYSWKAASWVNTGDLLDRMNLALALAANRLGAQTNFDALMGSLASEPATDKERSLEGLLLNHPLTPPMRKAVLNEAETLGRSGAPKMRSAANRDSRPARAALPRRAAFIEILHGDSERIARPTDQQATVLAGLLLGSPEFQKK